MRIHQATKRDFSRKYPPQALCVRLSFGIAVIFGCRQVLLPSAVLWANKISLKVQVSISRLP